MNMATTTLEIVVSDPDIALVSIYRDDPEKHTSTSGGTASDKELVILDLPTKAQFTCSRIRPERDHCAVGWTILWLGKNASEIKATVICDRLRNRLLIKLNADFRLEIKVILKDPDQNKISTGDIKTQALNTDIFRHGEIRLSSFLHGPPENYRRMRKNSVDKPYIEFKIKSDPIQLMHIDSCELADKLFQDAYWPLSADPDDYPDSEDEERCYNTIRYQSSAVYGKVEQRFRRGQFVNKYYSPMCLDGVPTPARVRWQDIKNQVRQTLGMEIKNLETRRNKEISWRRKRTTEYNEGGIWRPKFWRTWFGWDEKYHLAYREVLRAAGECFEIAVVGGRFK